MKLCPVTRLIERFELNTFLEPLRKYNIPYEIKEEKGKYVIYRCCRDEIAKRCKENKKIYNENKYLCE